MIEEYYLHLPHFFPLTLKISTRPISMPLVGKGRSPPQESRGGEQESPSLHRQGVCLVHGFPPPLPPSGSAEEEQVHQEKRVRSPSGKQDAATQRQRKDFPPLLLLCEVPSREQLR